MELKLDKRVIDEAVQEAAKEIKKNFIPKDVLDKIRAEIEAKIVKRPWLDFEDRERDRNDAFLEALDIIDKYNAESEEDILKFYYVESLDDYWIGERLGNMYYAKWDSELRDFVWAYFQVSSVGRTTGYTEYLMERIHLSVRAKRNSVHRMD